MHSPRKGRTKSVAEEARQKLKTLESAIAGKNFFGGETIGFVDIAAGNHRSSLLQPNRYRDPATAHRLVWESSRGSCSQTMPGQSRNIAAAQQRLSQDLDSTIKLKSSMASLTGPCIFLSPFHSQNWLCTRNNMGISSIQDIINK